MSTITMGGRGHETNFRLGRMGSRRQSGGSDRHAVTGVRITRRGRLVVAGMAVLMLAISAPLLTQGLFAGSSVAQAESDLVVESFRADGSDGAVVVSDAPTALVEHVVLPGETVWSMASQLPGDVDVRVHVERIQSLNGLGSAPLQVGDVILLPAGG